MSCKYMPGDFAVNLELSRSDSDLKGRMYRAFVEQLGTGWSQFWPLRLIVLACCLLLQWFDPSHAE
jgi:hypothetical protein